MAFVVARPGGRWEVRESWVSPSGPRARTLASFRLLTPEIATRATERAATALTAEAVMRIARRAGAPIADTHAEEVARELVALLSAGAVIPRALQRELQARFAGAHPVPCAGESADGSADVPSVRGVHGEVPEPGAPSGGVTVRERIIASAIECFRSSGIRKTRMSDIADHAGIARPNLYRHFSSRRALLLQAVVTEARSTHARRLDQLPMAGPAADLLTEALMLGHATAMNDEFILILIEEIPKITADLMIKETDILAVELEYWGRILRYCRERGQLRDGIDDQSIMRWLLFIQFSCLERREFFTDPDDLRSYLHSFVVPGLLKGY
jgi:AcrR family transcriptional regulator